MRLVHLIVASVPVLQIQEQIVDVIKAMTSQMTDEHKGTRAVTYATTDCGCASAADSGAVR